MAGTLELAWPALRTAFCILSARPLWVCGCWGSSANHGSNPADDGEHNHTHFSSSYTKVPVLTTNLEKTRASSTAHLPTPQPFLEGRLPPPFLPSQHIETSALFHFGTTGVRSSGRRQTSQVVAKSGAGPSSSRPSPAAESSRVDLSLPHPRSLHQEGLGSGKDVSLTPLHQVLAVRTSKTEMRIVLVSARLRF